MKELTHEEAKNAAKDFIAEKLQEAKKELEAGKELKPTITLLTYYPVEDRYGKIELPNAAMFFENELTKKLIRSQVAHAVELLKDAGKKTREISSSNFQYQLLAVVVLSDTYYYTTPIKEEKDATYLRPSEHPGRKEAISCIVSLKEGDFAEVHPYIRVDELVLFEQREDMSNAEQLGGNLTRLYPDNA
jgi:hypothetical protein